MRLHNKSEVGQGWDNICDALPAAWAGEVAREGRKFQGRSGETVTQLLSLCSLSVLICFMGTRWPSEQCDMRLKGQQMDTCGCSAGIWRMGRVITRPWRQQPRPPLTLLFLSPGHQTQLRVVIPSCAGRLNAKPPQKAKSLKIILSRFKKKKKSYPA